jgi:hypothetical protein
VRKTHCANFCRMCCDLPVYYDDRRLKCDTDSAQNGFVESVGPLHKQTSRVTDFSTDSTNSTDGLNRSSASVASPCSIYDGQCVQVNIRANNARDASLS